MQQRILLVEDEGAIRDILVDILKENGYLVDATGDGAKALEIIKNGFIDLVILDLGIETVGGETVFYEAKKHFPDLPIIILTARNANKDIVKGLNMGADDYIPKPFEMDELLARVNARLRVKNKPVLQIADLCLNSLSMEVKRGEQLISLTAREFKLLEYLLLNQGIVLSRESILDHVWLSSPDIETRVVDVYIGYLRKKIDEGAQKKLIHSIRGFGYVMKE